MRIFRHYTELPKAIHGGVLALGNFDGVHLGHQRVINLARAAAEKGMACGVMSFEPHPRAVFNPGLPPFRLTPFRIKARLIEALNLDFLLMQHFDLAFATHTPKQFVDEVLVQGLGVSQVVVGYDYAFGKGRAGNVKQLQEMAASRGFTVSCVDPVTTEDGLICSSSRIREALVDGRPREAARLLGRDWEIEGRVEHGDQRGQQLGFPTANIALDEYLRPAAGVYAVRAGVDHGGATRWLSGVANLGLRPTFGKTDTLLEVHVFDFDGDLYGRHVRVALVEFLRPERKFDGIDSLKAQIVQDCAAARQVLADNRQSP
jgi:riboflavin kinase / FMN adenylyltransferase